MARCWSKFRLVNPPSDFAKRERLSRSLFVIGERKKLRGLSSNRPVWKATPCQGSGVTRKRKQSAEGFYVFAQFGEGVEGASPGDASLRMSGYPERRRE